MRAKSSKQRCPALCILRSIKYRGVKVWNDIPNEIKNNNGNLSSFKKILKKHLISQVIDFCKNKKNYIYIYIFFFCSTFLSTVCNLRYKIIV